MANKNIIVIIDSRRIKEIKEQFGKETDPPQAVRYCVGPDLLTFLLNLHEHDQVYVFGFADLDLSVWKNVVEHEKLDRNNHFIRREEDA